MMGYTQEMVQLDQNKEAKSFTISLHKKLLELGTEINEDNIIGMKKVSQEIVGLFFNQKGMIDKCMM